MTSEEWIKLWRKVRPTLAAIAVVGLAACMWQLVGVEMAVFVAGEAVWWLEAVAGLWLATRIGWVKTTAPLIVLRVRAFASRLRGRARRARTVEPPGETAPDDPDLAGMMFV